MSIPLVTLMRNDGPPVFYQAGFRRVIEDHLSNLRNSRGSNTLNIESNMAYAFEFNLYGVLTHYQIPGYLHWIMMRVNGMTSPDEYQASMTSLIHPDTELVEKYRSTYVTESQSL